MAYYNPNDWSTIDPANVRTRAGDWDGSNFGPETYWTGQETQRQNSNGDWYSDGGTQVRQGNALDEWLKAEGGGWDPQAGNWNETGNFLRGLNTQYGLGPQDFRRGLEAYNAQNNVPQGSDQWWGGEARRRAYGQGLGIANPNAPYANAWETGYNRANETAQQEQRNQVMTEAQARDVNNGLLGLGGLGEFAGLVGGALGGASALGLTGGGALGQGALASQLAAEASSAVPLSGAAGATAGGGLAGLEAIPQGLDAYLPDVGGPPGSGGLNPGMDPSLDLQNVLTGTEGGAPSGTPSIPNLPSTPSIPGGGGGPGTPTPYTPDPLDMQNVLTGAEGGVNTQNWAQSLLSQGTGAIASAASALGMTPAALTSLLGRLIGGGLDAYSASQRSDRLQANADRAFNMGAPYRDRLAAYYANPSAAIANDPAIQASVTQGTNALARSLSARDGNPVGSGRALQELQNYATQGLYGGYGNELNRLANFGGLSNFNAASPQLSLAAANDPGVIGSLAATARQIISPPQSYGDILRSMGINTPLP